MTATIEPRPRADRIGLADDGGPQREMVPPADGDRTCRYCLDAIGMRWILPRGGEEVRLWLCPLCAEAALRIGRRPRVAPDPAGCRFAVEPTPSGMTAFVQAWADTPARPLLGFAVVYRAASGDVRDYRIDLSGLGRSGPRQYSGAACLAEAIGDAKLLLALRR